MGASPSPADFRRALETNQTLNSDQIQPNEKTDQRKVQDELDRAARQRRSR